MPYPLPWQPLFTTERLGRNPNKETGEFSHSIPEITVHGLLAVWTGARKDNGIEASVGDLQVPLWSRSLLKPIQLLCQLPFIQAKFPKLKPHHYAAMMSSHNGDSTQIGVLEEILDIALLNENFLDCPSTYPLSQHHAYDMKRRGQSDRPIYHPCSGKHLGMLLGLQAKGQPANNYLAPDHAEYKTIRDVLTWLCGDFPEIYTVDGCRMPNFALSAAQLAKLYAQLAQDLPESLLASCPDHLKEIAVCWPKLREYMMAEPLMVGGMGRLDTRIMEGRLTRNRELGIIAKEGADGLLTIGIEPTENFPDGVGIYLKLASGYDPHYLELIITEVFGRLGLGRLHLLEQDKVLSTHYYFDLHQPLRT